MPHYKAQVVLPMFTNLPEDVITNTYHFDAEPLVSLSVFANGVTPLLRTFYLNAYSQGIANYVSLASCYVKWYNMDLPEPREPLQMALGTLAGSLAISDVPTEVSCVLSFEALPTPGVPLASQRGRVYLGALGQAWIADSTVSSFPIFTPAALTAVTGAAAAFKDAVEASNLGDWVVFSPTRNETYLVNNGWVDNTPDTQRRRGVKATQRSLWS